MTIIISEFWLGFMAGSSFIFVGLLILAFRSSKKHDKLMNKIQENYNKEVKGE